MFTCCIIFAGDEAAEGAINKAIVDVSNKMKQSEAEEQSKTQENTEEAKEISNNESNRNEDEKPEQTNDDAEKGKILSPFKYMQIFGVTELNSQVPLHSDISFDCLCTFCNLPDSLSLDHEQVHILII